MKARKRKEEEDARAKAEEDRLVQAKAEKERIDRENQMALQQRQSAAITIQASARGRCARLHTAKLVEDEQERKRNREAARRQRQLSLERVVTLEKASLRIQRVYRGRHARVHKVKTLQEEKQARDKAERVRFKAQEDEKLRKQASFIRQKEQREQFQKQFGSIDSKTATLPAHFRKSIRKERPRLPAGDNRQ